MADRGSYLSVEVTLLRLEGLGEACVLGAEGRPSPADTTVQAKTRKPERAGLRWV